MFEAGASLSEIAGKVDIERSTTSKKAKKEECSKEINQQLILDDIERFSNASMKKANDLMTNTETGSDFKAIVDGVDKLSILTKINYRHAQPEKVEKKCHKDNQLQITIVKV